MNRLLIVCFGLLIGAGNVWGKLNVVTTTTHVTDLVKSVGGSHVEVIGLMGPGVDPHLYKSSGRDVTKLRKADLIFYSGLMLEGRMADVFFKMARRGTKVYAVTEKAPEERLLEPEEFEGHWDPHVWFDPEIWKSGVDVVVEALCDFDKKNAAAYRENAKQVKASYRSIKKWADEQFAKIPAEQRILITSHDAFNYFGRAFDFKVVAVQGISTATEAGLADIASTVDFIRKNKIKAIFVESSVSPSAINRISKDSGAIIGGELFSDAMGTAEHSVKGPGGKSYPTNTWEGMMVHNIQTIVTALQ